MDEAEVTERVLRNWLNGAKRVAVVGIGDELRRDDFVGVDVVRRLKGKVPENVLLIESETVPESFLEAIAQFGPTHTLLLDAGLVGLEPGHVRAVESCSALGSVSAVSTHALPLRIFCEYLEQAIGTKVMLIIVQPGATDFGEGLTREVRKAAETLVETLSRTIKPQQTAS